MNWFAEKILKHKLIVLLVFSAALFISLLLTQMVAVNYDIMDYLPEDSPSTVALDVMDSAFSSLPPNTRAMAKNVSISQALDMKQAIAAVPGVIEITWLDDVEGIYEPIETMPVETVEDWYKDNNALFSILVDVDVDSATMAKTIQDIQDIIGEDGAMAGDPINMSSSQEATSREMGQIVRILIPLIFIILLLTTSSWFEPILFLTTIGVSVMINTGTNAFKGEISFITQTSAAVLQLATSMDYSIFLLHRFSEFREEGHDVKEAMRLAMVKSFSPIASSGVTTIIGFASLTVMRFKIGPDMGLVLAKGIILSLLSVMFLLPVLAVYTYKIIDKTRHRNFLPSFKGLGRLVLRIGVGSVALLALILIPAFLAQGSNTFIYGSSAVTSTENSIVGKWEDEINDQFGKANQMVLLIPDEALSKEEALIDALYTVDNVSSIASYSESVGIETPEEIVPDSLMQELISGGYSRLAVTVSTSTEGEAAFKAVDDIRAVAENFYDDAYHLTGGSVNVKDLKDVVIQDNKTVALVSIIAIGITIMLTFRSLSLPVVLLVIIETAIWTNLSFPYFQGESMAYLGYMILSSIQLGATVDYAILMSSRYLENRAVYLKRDALVNTVADTTASIMTSSIILASSGFLLGSISSNGVTSQLGILIGRGALLSSAMVIFCLPVLLMLSDNILERTTKGLIFRKEGATDENNA